MENVWISIFKAHILRSGKLTNRGRGWSFDWNVPVNKKHKEMSPTSQTTNLINVI